MVKSGASLDETDFNGNSALHLAILSKQNKYARLLINKGADLNLKNKLDLTPLHIASILDNRDIAGVLMIKRSRN
jgi:ankyrin repeat protein